MCPHHGCAYDIKTGTVEYGPAFHNLPIFAVN
jgi:nitrite reductase/ring-hydroxylating ferredoxin subunit